MEPQNEKLLFQIHIILYILIYFIFNMIYFTKFFFKFVILIFNTFRTINTNNTIIMIIMIILDSYIYFIIILLIYHTSFLLRPNTAPPTQFHYTTLPSPSFPHLSNQ